VETFVGLLHLTWQTLEGTHQLSRKLSIDGDELVSSAARQLGVTTPVRDLLARRMGVGADADARTAP
jgi:hypothetical protein